MSIIDQLQVASEELKPLLKTADFNVVVNGMTNHQRHQWSRAGYPGLRKKDPQGPADFMLSTQLLHRLKERKKT